MWKLLNRLLLVGSPPLLIRKPKMLLILELFIFLCNEEVVLSKHAADAALCREPGGSGWLAMACFLCEVPLSPKLFVGRLCVPQADQQGSSIHPSRKTTKVAAPQAPQSKSTCAREHRPGAAGPHRSRTILQGVHPSHCPSESLKMSDGSGGRPESETGSASEPWPTGTGPQDLHRSRSGKWWARTAHSQNRAGLDADCLARKGSGGSSTLQEAEAKGGAGEGR